MSARLRVADGYDRPAGALWGLEWVPTGLSISALEPVASPTSPTMACSSPGILDEAPGRRAYFYKFFASSYKNYVVIPVHYPGDPGGYLIFSYSTSGKISWVDNELMCRTFYDTVNLSFV